MPTSPGVPPALAELTLNARYNDLDSVRELFEQYPDEIACVAVEPVAGNMNCIPPDPVSSKACASCATNTARRCCSTR